MRNQHPDSHINDISSDGTTKANHSQESPTNRPTSKILPSKFPMGFLKRQQSLGYDKNVNVQQSPIFNANNRGSIKANNVHVNNNHQSK